MSIEQENNEMLRNQIKEVDHHSKEIKQVVTKRTRVEPWVVAKMERASSDLSDVTHYLDGEKYGDGGNIYGESYNEKGFNLMQEHLEKVLKKYNLKYSIENQGKKLEYVVEGIDIYTSITIYRNYDNYFGKFYLYLYSEKLNPRTQTWTIKEKKVLDDLINQLAQISKVMTPEQIAYKKQIDDLKDKLEDALYMYGDSDEEMKEAIKTSKFKNLERKIEMLELEYSKKYADGRSMYADGGMVKKDRYGNDVKIGDAIHIRVLSGRYGQTKDYEGTITGFDKFGNVELDGQRSVLYTADYTNNDYEHGHHIWVEKINPKDIKDSLRVPKKFISTFSGEIDGKEFAIKGEDEFKEWAEKNYPGSTFGQWNPLYNKGWKYVNGEYISPDGVAHKSVNVYQSVEQGQGYLLNLFIPIGKAKKLPKPQKDILKIGDVVWDDENKQLIFQGEYAGGNEYSFNTISGEGLGYGYGKSFEKSDVLKKLKNKEWTLKPKFNQGDIKMLPKSVIDKLDDSILKYRYDHDLNVLKTYSIENRLSGELQKQYPKRMMVRFAYDIFPFEYYDAIKNYLKTKKMSDGGSMYADGGGVEDVVVLQDRKYPITYTVKPSGNRWLVVSSSPNWEEDQEMVFISKEDALNHAKIEAGYMKEFDPESAFMRSNERFAKGGKVGVGMMAWRGSEAYNIIGYDDSMDRWIFKSTTSGLEYFPKQDELNEFEFIKPKKMEYGGSVKVGDEFINTERGEKFYIEKVDTSDKSYPFYVLKSSPNDLPEVIGRNEFERYYKAGLYERISDEKYADGGKTMKTQSGDEYYVELQVSQNGDVIARQNLSFETGERYIEENKSDTNLDHVLQSDGSHHFHHTNGTYSLIYRKSKLYATGGGVSSENAEKIAKLEKVLSSTLVPDSVKEKARLEIEKLKSEGSSSSRGISAEQADLNKKALSVVQKAKITNYIGLVAEAIQDANYSSEGFKFAQLVDSSIKTKEDWYQAEDFTGDDKTRDAAIEIAQMCGWDGDKITEALYFVLKMNGEHRLADAVKKAMAVEEASYPNAITELTKRQTEYTQEIATRTGLRQSAVADFVAKNGLSESETLAIVSGLGRKQISASDVMTAVVGTPNNEYEQKIVAFAKSGEGFKSSESKSIRSVVESETKPSIRTSVVEVEKEQPKVSDDRLKGKHISDVSQYIAHRNIESITFKHEGKSVTVKGSQIFDGIYVDNKALGIKSKRTPKSKQPKVTRTQFEEESFEYGKGGSANSNSKNWVVIIKYQLKNDIKYFECVVKGKKGACKKAQDLLWEAKANRGSIRIMDCWIDSETNENEGVILKM